MSKQDRPLLKYWDRLCALQPYSFFLSSPPGVKRVPDKTGNWIERHRAQEIVDSAEAEISELRSALNAMLTHMGMDEDEWNKPTFDQARAALATAHADNVLDGQAPAGATDPWQQHMANQAEVIDCEALQRAMVQHGISFPEGGVEYFRASLGEMVNRFVRFATPAAPSTPSPTAQQAVEGGDADPLQGAANWLNDALVNCNVHDIQYHLFIGYNRAQRLYDAARAAQKEQS